MSTLDVLNTLIGIINSRKNKLNPTGLTAGTAANSGPSQANPMLPINPATSPANVNPPATPLSPNPDGSKNPALLQPTGAPRPSPMPPTQNSPQTEESQRQQLQQSDIYDLSGEKAAAEALKREDAFKQQSLDQKAQQTKEFFTDQDRKQQETLQDVQEQADQQLQQKAEKEFWDQKQQTEMQAGMDKELQGLHEAAKQEHQEWRNDFTQGICRDDVAALYNKDITDRVGQYKERLDDLGTNSVDAVQTIEKYKVKLQDEAAPQIEQKTGELHREHFPEYQEGAQGGPSGPGQGPNKGFGPFEGTKPGDFWPGPQSKPGDFWPGGGDKYPLPNEDFFKPLTKDNNPIDRSGETVATQGEIIPPEKPGPAPKAEPPTIDVVPTHVQEMEALPKPAEPAGLIPPPEKMTPLPQQAAQTDTADAVTSQPIQGSARFGAVGGTGKEIVGEGEKEFEENETAFGKKTAENVQAAGKIGDAASDVYGDKIDELNKEAFKTAVEQFHRNNPHADSGPQTSSAVVEKQILAADSVDIDMHGTDHVGAAVIGAVGTYQIIKNKYGDGITEGWQDLKDNVKVSSPEALDKLAEETKSSLESDQNKLLQQIEFNDKQGTRPAEPQPEQPDAQASKFANPKGPEESKFVHPDTVETTRPHPNLGELVTQPPDGARSAPATSMEYEGSATFGKVGGLSGQDAELVRLFAERQNDLGKAGQGVQDYAGQLKTMEAQAPAPTAPAPSLEVQTVPAAPQPSPAPAPTPAPQQPAPSISPSL